MTDFTAAAHIAVAVSTLICTAAAIFMIVMRGTFASKDAVTELSTRVTIVEQVASPGWLHTVSDRLGKVEGNTEGVRATLVAIEKNQDRMQTQLSSISDFLLENK